MLVLALCLVLLTSNGIDVKICDLQLDYQQLLQTARESECDKEQSGSRCDLPDTWCYGQAFQPHHWSVSYCLTGVKL